MPFVDLVQRSVFLDLAGLQSDLCDVETWIFCDAHGIKLRGIESARYASQCARQGSIGRRFRRNPETPSDAGSQDPHEVPTRLTNHRVENRSKDFFHARPVIADGFPEGIQTGRQDALFAQENGMQLHACALFESVIVTTSLEFRSDLAGRSFCPLADGRFCASSTNLLEFEVARPDSSPEKPVASGWLASRCKWIPLRLWLDTWFFTSLFLKEFMIAPVVLLPA
jgi:hypothetical protein